MKASSRSDDPSTGQFHGGVNVRIETPHSIVVKTLPAPHASERKDFHYHALPFFWALVDGDASELLSNGRERNFRPMVPTFTPAGESHAHSSGGRPPTGLGLILLPEIAGSIQGVGKLGPAEILDPAAVMTMHRLNIEAGRKDAASELAIEGLTYELLAQAVRYRSGPKDHVLPPWLSAARDLLHDRFKEKIRIAEIAREVGIHPIHLSTEFRRYFGTTPGHYLRQVRLSSAAGLLEKTSSTIGAIATDLGFYDEAHFAHAFKETFGITPSEYRQCRKSLS